MSRCLAIIGVGNIARRIIGGLLESGFDPQSLVLASRDLQHLRSLREQWPQIQHADCGRSAAALCDTILLCVKPSDMRDLCHEIAPELQPTDIVLSVAAGVECAAIARWLNDHTQLVRGMPNTPIAARKGVLAVYAQSGFSANSQQAVQDLFKPVAMVSWLNRESDMNAVTALCGSGPAYFFFLASAFDRCARQLDHTIATRWGIDVLCDAERLWQRYEEARTSDGHTAKAFCQTELALKPSGNEALCALYQTCVACTLLFMQGLRDAAQDALGMQKASAMTHATLSGALALAAREGDVERLREEITSKGGTTESALKTLQDSAIADILETGFAHPTEEGKLIEVAAQTFMAAKLRSDTLGKEVRH